MFDDFLTRAVLAGIGVALAAAPLGCFVVWRRMAYFGDATSHAAILGVAMSLALELPVLVGVVVLSLSMAVIVTTLSNRGHSMDTLLGVLAHGSLAVGLVAVSMIPGVRVDLLVWLFGDILAVTRTDLLVVLIGVLSVVALLVWRWSALLTATLNPDLAWASGLNPRREQLALSIALALTVAIAIKIVGALLIAAMLVIPAAAARPLSRSPEAMAYMAAGFGSLSVLAGLNASYQLDTPAGPSIVCAATALFIIANLWRPRW